jgi:hypothetical protein
MPHAKFTGIDFDFGGGRIYTVPPLTLSALFKFRKDIKRIESAMETDPLVCADVCIELAHSALIRNYPDMTRETVGDLIDLGNMVGVVECLMDVRGVLRKRLQAPPNAGAPDQGDNHG